MTPTPFLLIQQWLLLLLYGAASLYLVWWLASALWRGAKSLWSRVLLVALLVLLVPPLLYFVWVLALQVLFWVVVPLAALLLAPEVLRRVRGRRERVALALAAVPVLLWLAWAGGGQKVYYDWQVERLCAKDGGIKVYETVKLPAEKFDKWGMVNFYDPTQKENALGPEYAFKSSTFYYRRGDPQTWRSHYQVIRRLDGTLLGETVLYGRAGGDLPGPWHPSEFRCPEVALAGPNALLKAVFVQM